MNYTKNKCSRIEGERVISLWGILRLEYFCHTLPATILLSWAFLPCSLSAWVFNIKTGDLFWSIRIWKYPSSLLFIIYKINKFKITPTKRKKCIKEISS